MSSFIIELNINTIGHFLRPQRVEAPLAHPRPVMRHGDARKEVAVEKAVGHLEQRRHVPGKLDPDGEEIQAELQRLPWVALIVGNVSKGDEAVQLVEAARR